MDDSNEMKENNESNEKEEEVEAGSRMACFICVFACPCFLQSGGGTQMTLRLNLAVVQQSLMESLFDVV